MRIMLDETTYIETVERMVRKNGVRYGTHFIRYGCTQSPVSLESGESHTDYTVACDRLRELAATNDNA